MNHATKIGIILLSLGGVPAASDAACRYEEPRTAMVDATGATLVRIEAVAGELEVVGITGSRVAASGTACVSHGDLLEETRLDGSRRGDVVVIEARTADPGGFMFGSKYARLPFRVEVPANVRVEIRDGSGDLTVAGLAAVRIKDGSGTTRVRDVADALVIEDGSGDLHVERIGGTVRVTDGSGSIEISGARSDVIIEADGSGSIRIRDVNGNVTIEQDGSGSISVRNVGGDFTVLDDGSGGISVDGVRGKVSVPRD